MNTHDDTPAEEPAFTRPRRGAAGVGSLRPRSVTLELSNGPCIIETISRVGLDLSEYLAEQAEDYQDALRATLEDGGTAEGHAEGEEDRAVWQDGVLVAALRVTSDGYLEVCELAPGDHPGWRVLVDPNGIGPGEAGDALDALAEELGSVEVGPAPGPSDPPYTRDELLLLGMIRLAGVKDSFERLSLSGRYEPVSWDPRATGTCPVPAREESPR